MAADQQRLRREGKIVEREISSKMGKPQKEKDAKNGLAGAHAGKARGAPRKKRFGNINGHPRRVGCQKKGN